ncbi:MAG: tetratricopeptide repeat protein, partial [Acidobacteria bacterium]|nr:tetratricopeptide repeat protein [Acidobacteriota bacterium]
MPRRTTWPPSRDTGIRRSTAARSDLRRCLIRSKNPEAVPVAVDRDAALKQAEKLLRQGKLDGAIQEYVRLIEDQPKDWNSMNALGDLYLRAGNTDRAVEQFIRVADHLFGEGFYPKAAALYKKALKVKTDHEHTLLQLGEIAGKQGLLADAKTYFRQLSEQRRLRGDQRGAAECLIRLGTLDEADAESRIAAARAAQQIGDTAQAASLLKDAARDLEKQNRRAEALDVLVDAAQLDPGDLALRARLARECVKAGNLERASVFLTSESAGDDPDLLLALGQIELAKNRDDQARAVFTRLVTIAPDRHDAVVGIAQALAKGGRLESAFGCIDVVTDAALLGGDWDRAVAALQTFVREEPHVPALIKLVELCVDAGLEAPLRDAQAQLADAYLQAGKGAEARFIAEDFFEHDPTSAASVARLRRALEQLGETDPDRVIAERLAPAAAFPDFEPIIEVTEESIEVSIPDAEVIEAPPERIVLHAQVDEPLEDTIVLNAMEIDLSDALAGMGGPSVFQQPVVAEAPPPGPPQNLESVFEDIRARVSRDQQATDASAQYHRGLAHLREGRVTEAITDLQAAACIPLLRFKASSELADALERLGEAARALAVLMELDADAGGYRDVRTRIDHLTREQAGSHGG